MAKKRKARRLPVAAGLADIPKGELARWKVAGPVIGTEGYSSWDEWAAVYENCRDELMEIIRVRRERLLKNPTLAIQVKDELPVCERLYQAWRRGENPELLQAEIHQNQKDPRIILGVNGNE